MPTARLTPRSVAALTTDQVQEEYWDELLPGLALRVGRGGTKSWIVRYRANGTHRRLTLGRYPAVGLADARERARRTMAETQGGEDPAAAKQDARNGEHTFAAMADAMLDGLAGKTREKTHKERRRIVDTELLPYWRDRPVDSIRRKDVRDVLDRIAKRGAPVMANRTLAVVTLLFNAALDSDSYPTLENNPAERVKRLPEKARERYLTRDEIRTVWHALDEETPLTRALFRFTLLTAQRVGSVCAMRWEEIDTSHVWRIPAENFKGKRSHLVPLSAEARAVLAEIRSLTGGTGYVFPGRGGENEHRASVNKAVQAVRERTPLEPWTIHDFRTTFRTHATRPRKAPRDYPNDPVGLGVTRDAADAVLGHKEQTIGFRSYQGERERYMLPEKRDALTRWGTFVRATLESPETPGNSLGG